MDVWIPGLLQLCRFLADLLVKYAILHKEVDIILFGDRFNFVVDFSPTLAGGNALTYKVRWTFLHSGTILSTHSPCSTNNNRHCERTKKEIEPVSVFFGFIISILIYACWMFQVDLMLMMAHNISVSYQVSRIF